MSSAQTSTTTSQPPVTAPTQENGAQQSIDKRSPFAAKVIKVAFYALGLVAAAFVAAAVAGAGFGSLCLLTCLPEAALVLFFPIALVSIVVAGILGNDAKNLSCRFGDALAAKLS